MERVGVRRPVGPAPQLGDQRVAVGLDDGEQVVALGDPTGQLAEPVVELGDAAAPGAFAGGGADVGGLGFDPAARRRAQPPGAVGADDGGVVDADRGGRERDPGQHGVGGHRRVGLGEQHVGQAVAGRGPGQRGHGERVVLARVEPAVGAQPQVEQPRRLQRRLQPGLRDGVEPGPERDGPPQRGPRPSRPGGGGPRVRGGRFQ